MPLLKNSQFVDDDYITVGDEDALPQAGRVLVSFPRLKKEWDEIAKLPAMVGVRLANTDKVEELTPYLSKIALVVLSFPAFTDGRSYSIARGLRLDGYRGELRAEGNVLPDQLQYMRQIGFDSFLVTDRFPLEVWQAAAHQMSLAYQRGLFRQVQETEVWSIRHQGFEAWEEQPHAG
ncbi:DUF934 domain-containing protein [Aestuariivirga litoralis]|uniref:DUF934 domain-containing protein n=1 Tax=Aestuariivirga litoralis TaxID=2650924 RepID=UPI0018C685AB|nr:DUF934 domain-containing protein [Aestuariivirga litoralis]MBG1231590.1 DUF934 domain-containing protein [Aestuariivirga litoralis]